MRFGEMYPAATKALISFFTGEEAYRRAI